MVYSGKHLTLKTSHLTEERVTVTPDLAQTWLDTQIVNRPINRRAIATYAHDMREGGWQYAGDPIRFDRNGHLIDGQHRLKALTMQEDGMGLEFLVILGLPPESQLMMDQGRKRSTGQQLSLVGYRNAKSLAAGIRLLLFWEQGKVTQHGWSEQLVSNTATILGWAEHHPEQVEVAHRCYGHIRRGRMLPAVGMCVALRTGRDYADLTEEFFRDLDTMIDQPQGSPLLAFRRRMDFGREKLQEGGDTGRYSVRTSNDVDQLGFLAMTWNTWIADGKRTMLKRPVGGWTADNFPELDI